MNEIVLNYIVQAILGGASGYITNDYAINMLFKEYTPLKVGGVIKKTRGEFIENLSSMVENDIINKKKLQEILGDDNFKIQFEKLAADFYNTCIKDAVSNYTWDEIISDKTNNFVQNLITENSADVYELIVKHINIGDFLNENQINSISEFFYNSVLELFEENELIIENLLLSLYDDNLKLTLNNILNENISQLITSNLIDAINDKIIELNDLEFKKIVHLAGIDTAFRQSANLLLNKKISEVINLNEDVINKIDNKALLYINSEKGYEFILKLCTSVFSYCERIDKSIFELLDKNFEENLKLYIIESIPGITEKIVNWIRANNNAIDKLLEDSVDEVINESDGLKAKLLSTIKNTYLKDLSKRYSIIDKLIEYVESISEPEKLGDYIGNKAIEILNDITVGEIVNELENNGLTAHRCTEIIASYLNSNFNGILNTSISYINEVKISKILTVPSDDELIIILKKLYPSRYLQSFLSEKLSIYADDILSKEFGSLLNRDKVKDLSHNLNKYITKMLKDNNASFKKWISNQINNSVESLNIVLDNKTISLFNQELFNIFENYIDKLRNIELSTAVNQLNEINNIARSSSDYLRSYAIKNTDTILKDSIKVIATDNLNKLNDDELVDLANDFIGRELKPIMFFGGVLGVIAGLLLAIFQNKALNPQEISIANMALYAFVGFITNVIAINMIFKPYKENKLLSKIPFFKNFSLGYIVKNQKIFAEKTSHFIDNSLLNKQGINELFDKHEENIKSSFIKSAKDNDYIVIKNLLSKNKHNIVNKVYVFIDNKLKTNIKELHSFFYEKIINTKLSYLVNKSIKPLKQYIHKSLNAKSISKVIYNNLDTKHVLRLNYISDYLSAFIDNLTEDNIKKYIYNIDNKYDNCKQINDLITDSQIRSFEQFISNRISTLLLTKSNRDKLFDKSYLWLYESINKDKNIEEIFDGKLKAYVDSLIPKLTEGTSNLINNSIQNNKGRITLMITREIKNQLGFIEKSMYTLMNGDAVVDELIKKIVHVKIPAFLELKKNEINNIISTTIDDKVYKSKSEKLYLIINKLHLNELVDNYVCEHSEKIDNTIMTVINSSIKGLEHTEIKSVLNLFYLDNIETAFEMYEAELNTFIAEVSAKTQRHKSDIIELCNELNKLSFDDILKNIKYEDVEKLVININNQINDNIIEELTDDLINYFINYCGATNIGSIINKDDFIISLKNYIGSIIESDEFETTVKKVLNKTIETAISNDLNFINDASKDFLFNIFIEASINSVKRNLSDILASVEFNKIAQEEIENMEPQKIHEMFNSFGEKYFRRLMVYGFGGFVFGINVYIGMSLTTLKVISELTNKNK